MKDQWLQLLMRWTHGMIGKLASVVEALLEGTASVCRNPSTAFWTTLGGFVVWDFYREKANGIIPTMLTYLDGVLKTIVPAIKQNESLLIVVAVGLIVMALVKLTKGVK